MRVRVAVLAVALAALLPAPKTGSASSLAFVGIRPGAWMTKPNLCTMNFIFSKTGQLRDGGPFYIGTAKHCVMAYSSEDPRGKPVELAVVLSTSNQWPVLITVGTVAWVTKGEISIGNDFALVQIDRKFDPIVTPSMAIVGGPTSAAKDEPFEAVTMVGHGAGLGAGGTARSGVVTRYPQEFPRGVGLVMPVIAGDSGSPVRTVSGAALSNVTDDGINRFLRYGETPVATVYGTLVSRVTSQTGLQVVTCPSLTPWPWFGCPPR